MSFPTIRLVFDRKKVATEHKRGLVQIEVLHNRQRKYIGTGIRLFSFQWRNDLHVVNSPTSLQDNEGLNALMGKVEAFVRHKIEEFGGFDLGMLDGFGVNAHLPDVESFILAGLEKCNLAEGTIRHHHTVLAALREFGKIQTFADCTLEKIEAWDDFVRQKGIAEITIYGYHKRLRKWLREAKRKGLLAQCPYDVFRVNRGESKPREYLSEAEVDCIKNTPLSSPRLDRVRDLYLLQCYTGLAYKDLSTLDFRSCVEKRGDNYVIVARRVKTGTDFYIVLLPHALAILRKYNFLLPIPSLTNYNLYIKEVMEACGIEKSLSSHTARHTFAVIALNNGIPIEVVSCILGHTNIRTTQIYAKIVDKTVDKAFEDLKRVFSP